MTQYRIPKSLSKFQKQMYKHLIDWKRERITEKPGQYAGHTNDAILPKDLKGKKLPHLYEPVHQRFFDHQKAFHFKTHKFADHMASSQIACANLFLPIMANPDEAPGILSSVKPDVASIVTDQLDSGFRIEFWDEITDGLKNQKGLLGDHNKTTGTDSDFAIAYKNHDGQLCLWLIEHKLTEAEFTTCGGARSKGRKSGRYSCDSTADILADLNLCYYHGHCQYNYWNITRDNEKEFPRKNLIAHDECPFKGGMNQLWRNTVLALAIEDAEDGPYKDYEKVFFSVCHHPKNHALQKSIDAFSELLGDKNRFFSFTSEPLVDKARASKEPVLCKWADWYSELYFF